MDYNFNGEGFKAIRRPFDPRSNGNDSDNGSDDGNTVCMFVGGSNKNETQKVPYLNFFPTVEQMELYTIGNIVPGEVWHCNQILPPPSTECSARPPVSSRPTLSLRWQMSCTIARFSNLRGRLDCAPGNAQKGPWQICRSSNPWLRCHSPQCVSGEGEG